MVAERVVRVMREQEANKELDERVTKKRSIDLGRQAILRERESSSWPGGRIDSRVLLSMGTRQLHYNPSLAPSRTP